MKKSNENGFTVVEILCVIGIMAGLLGLIFPVFAKARIRAKSASCMANVRSVGLSSLIYCGDNDDRFPFGTDDWSKTFSFLHGTDSSLVQSLPLYTELLRPYVKGQQVFKSPLDIGMSVTDFGGMRYERKPSLYDAVGSSYLYFVPAGLKLSGSSEYLSNLPIFMSAAGHWQCGCRAMVYGETTPENDPTKNTGYRYSVSFGDGHAKTLSYEQWNQISQSKAPP